ncbi:MAG: Gfo/Idh/MocA family oxidoreductase [Gemmatimonadota bacterium]
MKVCMVGEGAQGITHMEALQQLDGIEVVTVAGGLEGDTREFAARYGIPHWSLDLEECLRQDGVEAVVITSPNQVHADQAVLALGMGKHVLLELPMGLTLDEARRVVEAEEKSGLVCMVCHTNRYNPVFQEVRRRIAAGQLHLHHIVQQTYFFRRTNENRFGKPRIWVDDLLWHQACHMVDMVFWLLGDPAMSAWGQVGPLHPTLGIPLDVTIGLRSQTGCLVTAAQSFNHHGPIQGLYRFIGEEATYLVEGGKLLDHQRQEIAVEGQGEGQNGEFLAAIRQGRKALTSCSACLPVMEIIDRVQGAIEGGRSTGAPSRRQRVQRP